MTIIEACLLVSYCNKKAKLHIKLSQQVRVGGEQENKYAQNT